MITLHEEISVARSAKDCFRYVADFDRVYEWDATARTAIKVTEGPPAKGSRFEVTCAVGPTTITINYEIIDFQPWHSIELKGECTLFSVTDTILFEEHDGQTRIDYTAEFNYRWGLASLEKQFLKGMQAMGKRSLAGLQQALEDAALEPAPLASSIAADAWVVPGIAMFTRWGYRRGQAIWSPMSRFMDQHHVVITGANSGLGLATAISLAHAGANLTLVIRNPDNEQSLRETLARETGREDIVIEIADLSLMSEVKRLSHRLLDQGKPIDVLVNNAGALFNDYGETGEGFERSFALLLLSPYLLTTLLHPLLAGHAEPARVINVVSGGMYTEKLVCKRLIMKPERYNGPRAYARAKRGLTIMTELWATQWRGDNIVVNAMHPGWADTPGVASALPTFKKLTQKVLRNAREGADTIIWLARAKEADKVSGKLFLDREPRTPYLLKKTREAQAERQQLEVFLQHQLDTVAVESVTENAA